MNESNGMALIVGTARAWESEDAARRAYLDRRCAELKQHPEEPEPVVAEVVPLKAAHFEASGLVCFKCRAKALSTENSTGLCRDCYQSTGRTRRAYYREIFNEQKGRAA